MHGVTFKKRAPRAIKEIRAFAERAMVSFSPHEVMGWGSSSANHSRSANQGTKDVRLDPQLNKKVWEAGVKGVPFRLRVRISRKRNDEEGAKERLYSYVQAVNVKDAKGLHTAVVDE
jgi:large subunit ribosomal protein L31e